jgi:biotin transport system permease protein
VLSLISPVPSFWQRVPTAIKMAGLCLLTLLLFSSGSLWASIAILLCVAGCYLTAGQRFALHGLRLLRPLVPFVVVVTIWHLLSGDPQKAALLVVRISAAVAAANLVTMTSALSDIVAIIERMVSPLRYLGVRPRVIGLAVALVIRRAGILSRRQP